MIDQASGTSRPRRATDRRRRNQSGQEIFEFALVAVLLVPIFMGSFIVGMNLIRSIQCNQVCRDLDDMYIHGGDFSTYGLQQEAQRLAQGLNLQVSGFAGDSAGHEQSNTGNSGYGLVTVTRVMWIGGPSSGSCSSVLPAACTNQDSFVFVQQIQFGNGTLANSNTVTMGQCPAAVLNSTGIVDVNYVTDARAAIPSGGQTALQALWQSNSGGTTALTDQQVSYVVETYFQSPDLNLGSLSGNGVYARYFF